MKYIFITLISSLINQIMGGPVFNFIKCASETPTDNTEMDVRSFKTRDMSSGECVSACLMRSIGVIDNTGKISPSKIMDIVRAYADPVNIGKGQVIVFRCGFEANQEEETCATLLTFNRCIQETSEKKSGIKNVKTLPELSITLPPITLVIAMLSLL